jgi:ABC-type lipoprotein release transport system permease subunit
MPGRLLRFLWVFVLLFVSPFRADGTVWRIALRNVWRNPRRTGVVVSAVAVGIAGVVLTMAINYGMIYQMVENAIETELGHVQVHAAGFDQNPEIAVRLEGGGADVVDAMSGIPGVTAWARRVRGEGFLMSPRSSAGVRVVGVEPEREAGVSVIADSTRSGAYLDGVKRRILIGEKLARSLEVGVGDKVVLSVQDLAGDITGEALRVGGLYKTANGTLDGSTIFMRLDEGQALYGLGGAVSEVVAVVDGNERVDAVRDELAARLPGVEVRTWEELRPVLLYMVDVFDQQAIWVYVAVFVAMAFGIANVLMMAVYERIREIGIMMAVGMRADDLVAMVLIESMAVTALGLFLGFLGAVAGVWALQDGIDLSAFARGLESFGVGTRLVPVLRWDDFTIPMIVAMVTALIASLWPAVRAVSFRPAEAVRKI